MYRIGHEMGQQWAICVVSMWHFRRLNWILCDPINNFFVGVEMNAVYKPVDECIWWEKLNIYEYLCNIYLLFWTDEIGKYALLFWCAIEYICIAYEAYSFGQYLEFVYSWPAAMHTYIPIKLILPVHKCSVINQIFLLNFTDIPRSSKIVSTCINAHTGMEKKCKRGRERERLGRLLCMSIIQLICMRKTIFQT